MQWTLFVAIAIIGSVVAQGDENAVETSEGGGSQSKQIKCVECNSIIDDWCLETDDVEKKVKDGAAGGDCPAKEINGESKQPVGCRKTMQYIEATDEDTRVMRECAYTGENVDGMKRTGNKGVLVYYYQCDNDDYCNSAVSVTSGVAALSLAVLARLMA